MNLTHLKIAEEEKKNLDSLHYIAALYYCEQVKNHVLAMISTGTGP